MFFRCYKFFIARTELPYMYYLLFLKTAQEITWPRERLRRNRVTWFFVRIFIFSAITNSTYTVVKKQLFLDKQIIDFMKTNPRRLRILPIFRSDLKKTWKKIKKCRIKKWSKYCGGIGLQHEQSTTKITNVLKFEDLFYQHLNKQLSQTGRDVANKKEQSNFKIVRIVKFSQKWWIKFQSDCAITWRRICGNRKPYTCTEVEKDRERLRTIMNTYVERDIFYLDESSFFPEFNGNYSLHSPTISQR